MDFKNKVIVVTGGANGIGRSLCEHFARAKAKVVVMDIEVDRAREVAFAIGGLGVGGYVSVESDIKRAVLETERALGPIDIFVSNAGVAFELEVIAAVVLGGTSLMGGRGSVAGTVLGALTIVVIGNGLILLHVSPFFTQIVTGAIILIAIWLNTRVFNRIVTTH